MDQINIEVNIPGVDESITSVKELRARISELKDSLVSLEAGTEERYHTDGHYCGKIEPMDFFEKGWNNTPKEAILNRIMEFGMKRIDEIEKKY